MRLNLDDTYGAMMIGVLLGAVLLGVTFVQVWHYYSNYSQDPWRLKLLVGAVLICDILHQSFISHALYVYVISNFANPAALQSIVPSLVAQVIMTLITFALVQSFFAYRIYILSQGNRYLACFVVALILCTIAVLLVYVVKCFQLSSFLDYNSIEHLGELTNICSTATDVAIAGSMVILLQRGRTGLGPSEGVMNRLLVYVVTTGILTSSCSIGALIPTYLRPEAYIYMPFFFVMSRLYANSLFATLNARNSMRASIRAWNEGGDQFSSIMFAAPTNIPMRNFGVGQGSYQTSEPSSSVKVNDIRIDISRTCGGGDDDDDAVVQHK